MLRWVEQDKILLALNEYGIFQWTFKDFPHSSEIESEISVELFRITCCGLDLNPKTNSIAVGDFAGNIMVFDTVTHQLLYHKMIPSGIRCLSWDTDGDHVYVGALDGTLFKISQELEPVNLFDLQSDVICMSFKQGLSRNYLAIGVKNGDL